MLKLTDNIIMKYFQPVLLFAGTWIFVIFLLSLRLSNLLESSVNDAITFFLMVFACFTAGYLVGFLTKKKIKIDVSVVDLSLKLKNRYFLFIKIWVFLTIIEIIVSGGVPVLWLLLKNGKTYFDFGIQSVHGLLNALGMMLCVLSFYLFKKYKDKKYLYYMLFLIFWYVIVISRQVIIVMLMEITFIFFIMAKNKLSLIKTVAIYGFIVIFLFGIVGDMRSGADAFYELAQPSDNWPNWLPSGFLWVYVYLTTPINNLIFNFQFEVRELSYLFPNTLSLLLPSFIRDIVFGQQDTVSGNLVTPAFNVSSAFMSSYMDMGKYGLAIFAFVIGLISNLTWWATGSKRFFFRAITFQCIILSIFYNHFFYLPVAFQYVWFILFFMNYKKI
ncbi:oligosaccharide repeat unit polymerase [Pedobacter terrae]|uniref:Oligosaccharide repeat unit polymerase n=1 Tax=Pedobacter terrae TaxID=405671 RepID=A0A1G7RPZ0_9SPHI|nr:O-antigen polymerase [Pedobacter terrae]SDG12723.1 oligosaccharide repeat unit polymerase [Pedobacter terrae]